MSTKLFVGNLSFKTTENDLQDAFAACGTVVETNIMMDRMTGRPRGFAFVSRVHLKKHKKRLTNCTAKNLMAAH
jgi:RNA recognition motif-containing protein